MFPQDFKLVDVGVLRVSANIPYLERIGLLHNSMFELMQSFQPHICVMENIFFGKDPLAALKLGQIRGAFISASSRCQVPMKEIASTAVKRLIAGHGHAQKEEVCLALKHLMGFERGNLPLDASDALAIALSYGMSEPSRGECRGGNAPC